MLKRNYLSTLENVAQAVGTIGPNSCHSTLVPVLILIWLSIYVVAFERTSASWSHFVATMFTA